MPKRKNKTKKIYKTKDGFADIPKTLKTLWRTDQFGRRKVINIEKHTSRIHVDNKGLATDYPLQLKENAYSRRLFKKKTRKKYNSKTIEKKINKMSANKLQNLYYFLLEKDKSRKK